MLGFIAFIIIAGLTFVFVPRMISPKIKRAYTPPPQVDLTLNDDAPEQK